MSFIDKCLAFEKTNGAKAMRAVLTDCAPYARYASDVHADDQWIVLSKMSYIKCQAKSGPQLDPDEIWARWNARLGT